MSERSLDLTALDPFEAGFPYEVFAELRTQDPVWWHPATENTPGGEGFWVISSYDALVQVARDAATFSSQTGPGRDGAGGTLIEDLPTGITGVYLQVTDDPHHGRMRKLISSAFTPRAVRALDENMRLRSAALVDSIEERGSCDFLMDVARELPLQVIAEMIGVPQEDRHQLFEWTSVILDYKNANLGQPTEQLMQAGAAMYEYGTTLIEKRRQSPTDDIFSHVVHATLEENGEEQSLSEGELHGFFNLLFSAGSETTRNAIAGGLLALMEHPDQLALLRTEPELMPSAVEEILRWTSPVYYNRRTATVDTTLCGKAIRAGQKTTHWYPPANRDPAVFENPETFDLRRSPNPHVSFNQGNHFCLGANLARQEISILLDEVLRRLDEFERTGPVVYSRSNKHAGMQTMPIQFTSRK